MSTTPFAYACTKAGGFVMDPNEKQPMGYVTALTIGTEFANDLVVTVPFNPVGVKGFGPLKPSPTNEGGFQATVVGVIDTFEWDGAAADALILNFWSSQNSATQLKSLQQATLATTTINALSWWIINYDQETKQWYEASYPVGPPAITGIVGPKENPQLDVDLTGAPVADGIDVMVYKVAITVSPPANGQYPLHFANSPQTPVIKSWGLAVG